VDPTPSREMTGPGQYGKGMILALVSYGLWGIFPVYFRVLAAAGVPDIEVVAHRIVWSFLMLGVFVSLVRRWGRILTTLRSPRSLLLLLLGAMLISTNWVFFVVAVSTQQLLQSSLGYFLGPMVAVMLGIVFLHERPRPWQIVAIALALTGVAVFTRMIGQFPTIAIILACSFALYGLMKKLGGFDALTSLTVETMFLSAPAMICIVAVGRTPHGEMATIPFWLILALAGPVTVLPLFLWTAATRRLPLSTVGMLQYIVPSAHFGLAVLDGEAFGMARLISFIIIWIAVAIYVIDLVRNARSAPQAQEIVE